MGSLEMIGRKSVALLASFWRSKLRKMSARASETDIEVFSLFGIICLFQKAITSQRIDCLSYNMLF